MSVQDHYEGRDQSEEHRTELPHDAGSRLREPCVYPVQVDLRYRTHVVFGVLSHPRVIDLGDHRGYGQKIFEISSQLECVVEVLKFVRQLQLWFVGARDQVPTLALRHSRGDAPCKEHLELLLNRYSGCLPEGFGRADERTRTADLEAPVTSDNSCVAGVCTGLQMPHI
jgi:hypothetical protein